ncbi:hypothetical protein CGLO_18202 [Colletotrichum gloeosporioides Cg-14]|uniref:Uncharacterized protein n=1 Tax=Colletotrichum gloeosporioides (strain Cg-14) TaxID=1237896 RepID=T0JRZ5_COLGC|nr:hypothetical protein CGLO_18202 [Colletotrichum gloeosporioides Cg-14]
MPSEITRSAPGHEVLPVLRLVCGQIQDHIA